MPQESRVKKSLLNAKVNLLFYFLTLVVSFFSRKIFLDTLGADFVGLTGTLYNLLGFLNLAELGIGSAIGYVLYKPLYDHNESKINEVISVFGYLYRWIGFIILGVGCVLACFLPLIFPHTKFEMGIIYFAYFSFLISSLIGYFANYKQTLLGADQKNYVVTAYFQTANIVKILIQMSLAYYTGSYYLWVAIELIFGIIYSIILNWKIRQVYPWLRSEIKQGKLLLKKYPEIFKYVKQLFVHKLGGFAQFQTAPFLVYVFVSLRIVAFYGNYTIIVDKLTSLMNTVLGSTEAGVGNLIAEGNKGKIMRTFWELTAIRFWVAGILAFGLYNLMDPFIILWLGEKYLLSHLILILIIIDVFTRIVFGCSGQFLFGYGLFQDIWAPIVQMIIYLVSAIIGGYFWGLSGIVFASIISTLVIIGIWKPFFLYSCAFKESVIKYWLNWFSHIIVILLAFFISMYAINYIHIDPANSIYSWAIYSLIIMGIYVVVSTSLMWIFLSSIKNVVTLFSPHK